MKKAAFKRIGAFILTLVLVIGLLPTAAFAASETVTIYLDGIAPNNQVNVTVENGAPVTLNTTSVSGADSAVQLTLDDPEGKFVKVTSTDGNLIGADIIENEMVGLFRWSLVGRVELIDAAAGLPINFFILQPNNEPSSTGNYSNYLPFGIAQGSGMTTAAAFLDPAVHNEIRNAPLENTITDYVATWPGGRTAEEFKEFGTQTFTFRNAYGGNAGSDSFSSEEYTIRWISICLRGGDYGNCAQCSNESQVHAHVDGVLTKKVSPATMYIKKTIPQAQSETENFVFTLERLLQDTNMGPTYEKDPSFADITMTATIPAGANEANVVLPAGSHETIGFGYYRILETSSAKWKSDPVYVQVASDGTLRYDSDLEGEFTTIATEGSPVIIENTIQEYTITYDLNGGEPGNANEDLSYANRKYGTATPTITAPTRTGYTFGGWTPAFSSTVVGNANYVATWTGKAGTAYKVEYYKQDLYNPGKYDLVNADTENETGTTDATVNLEGNTEIENKYDSLGYVINKTHPGSKLTGTIAADGSLVLRVYYDLKTYTVRWVDVNGDELGKDTGVRHGTMPTYDGAEPAGPDTAAINYIFKEWSPALAPVTADVVYTATYTSEAVPYGATVYVTLDGNPVNIDAIKGSDAVLILKRGSATYPLSKSETGTYVNSAVPSGTYDIIRKNGDDEHVTGHTLVINGANGVGYLPHYSVTYDLNYDSTEPGFNRTAAVDFACGRHEVNISADNPTRDGYVFDGWTLNAGGTGRVYKKNDQLTDSITAATTLYAKWLQNKEVKVTVVLNHKHTDSEIDDSTSRGNVNVQIQAPVPSGWTGSIDLSGGTAVGNETKYENVSLGTLLGGQTMGSVVAYKEGYVTDSANTSMTDADGVIHYIITLKYTPTDFDLDYTVKMDAGIPAAKYPQKVTVAALKWDGSNWVSAGVSDQLVTIDAAGQGSGTFVVPKEHGSTLTVYRIDVTAYDPAGGYTDTLYVGSTAAGSDVGVTYDASKANLMSDSLEARISLPSYKVTFDPKGGTLDGTTSVKEISGLYYVPELSGFVPVKDNNTFGGWYKDESCTEEAVSGADLTSDITLYAKWKPHRTISGTVEIGGSYGGNAVDNADLPKTVSVILEKKLSNGKWEDVTEAKSGDLSYTGAGADKKATYNYSFTNLPDDGTEYRIVMNTVNFEHWYDNDNNDGADNFAKDANNTPNFVAAAADIDVRLKFVPATFKLKYQIDTVAIGENFRPTSVNTWILGEDINQTAGVPQLNWRTIIQQGTTATTLTLESNGVTDSEYDSVWIYRPDGHPYSYAIRLQEVTYKPDGVNAVTVQESEKELAGLPFDVRYIPASTYYDTAANKQVTTLVAKLTPKQYDITYKNLDPTVDNEADHFVENGHTWSKDTPISFVPSIPEDYVFLGWEGTGYADGKIAGSVDHDVVLTAQWAKKVKVTFKIENGTWSGTPGDTAEKTLWIEKDSSLVSGQIPTGMQANTGYGTGLWSGDVNAVVSVDTVFTYTYQPVVYNITYNLNGGSVGGSNPNTYTVETNTFVLFNPTRTGYTFKGWSGTELTGDTNKNVTITKGSTGNREFTANWEKVIYNITYNLNGGRIDSANPAVYDTETGFTVDKLPTRTGYNFLGWLGTDITGTPQQTFTVAPGATGDRSYTAQWQAGTGTKFVVEHYKQNLADDGYTLYESVDLAGTTDDTGVAISRVGQPGYEGFKLNDTHPDSKMSGTIVGDGSLVLKVYYDRETYTVVWKNDNGDVLETDTDVKYGTMAVYNKAELPTKEADAQYIYTFKGWDKEVAVVTKNETYTATYSTKDQTYNGTIHVILDGTYSGTDHDLISGTHKTIDEMMGSGTKLFLNKQVAEDVGGQMVYVPTDEFYALSGTCTSGHVHGSTGECDGYSVSGLKNGTYRVYAQKTGEASPSKLSDQLVTIYGSDRVRYVYFYSVTYDMGYAGSPAPVVEYYHSTDSVTLPAAEPARDKYLFTGWWHKVGTDDSVDPSEMYDAGTTPINSIKAPHVFVAQWEKDTRVNINLTVNIDHTASGGTNPDIGGDLHIEPTYRPKETTQDFVEVPGYEKTYTASEWYDNSSTITTFVKNSIFTSLTAKADYSVNVILPHYSVVSVSDFAPVTDTFGNETYNITVNLKYNPDLFTLGYQVVADDSVPEELIPTAVDIKVTSWNANVDGKWAPISRHEHNSVDVELQDLNGDPIRTASGTYDVPVHRAENSKYYYRVAVAGFSLRDGTELNAIGSDDINYNSVTNAVVGGGAVPFALPVYYADGAYYATVEVTNGANAISGTSLSGAYGHSDNHMPPFHQHGDIIVRVYANLCDVTLDLNYDANGDSVNEVLETIENQFRMPDLSGKKPTRTGFTFDGWYTDSACNDHDKVATGNPLNSDVRVFAKWKPDKTISGKIDVAKTYTIGTGASQTTHTLYEHDRPAAIEVLLQKLNGTTVSQMLIPVTYPDASDVGTGNYSFTVPDDGTVYRIYTLTRNFKDTYWNEELTAGADYTPNNYTAVFGTVDPEVATVNSHLVYAPANFDLHYSIDASAIGEDFRPTKVQTFVLGDKDPTPVYQWGVISQMVHGSTEVGQETTGDTSDGITEDTYPVWQYHSAGHAYSYAIRLQSVTYKEDGINNKTVTKASTETFGTSVPFTITYQYPAYYEGHNHKQNRDLAAKLEPRNYDITYDLNAGSDTVTGMDSAKDKHVWSKITAVPEPVRSGYTFKGWETNVTLDEDGNIPGSVCEDVTLKAKWSAIPYLPPVDGPSDKPELNNTDHVAYIIGYEDGTVRPQRSITRAEVATIFFRLLTDESRNAYWTQTNEYTDVKATAWYNNAVSTLSNADIFGGYPDNTFRPNAPITRAEFATIAARFSEVVYNGGNSFTDVPENHWAARFIALAEHLGWIGGYPDGSFKPSQAITRAEAMTLINRVLERAVDEEGMLADMVTWSDNRPAAWYYEAVQEATNSHKYVRTDKPVSEQKYTMEKWTKILEAPDWSALEKAWSKTSGR